MKYFLGGYYLIKLQPVKFGSWLGKSVYTCSECINDNLVDTWSFSWTRDNDKLAKEAKENFNLTDENIFSIRHWVDQKHNENILGWMNVFTNPETVVEYKNSFFSHLKDIKILALYFDESASQTIINQFKPKENIGEIGIRLALSKQVEDTENANESLLGFDFIGLESSGDFHSFHCHDIGNKLEKKFGLELNKYGVFDNSNHFQPVLDYLNDPESACEPVPWFVAKTKLVNIE